MLSGVAEGGAPGREHLFGHAQRRERLGVGAPGYTGVWVAQMGSQRVAPGIELERSAQRAGHVAQRLWMDADGRGEHGDVAGQRLEHGQPEALARGGDEHGVGCVDPQGDELGRDGVEGAQFDVGVAGQGECVVVVLLRT